MEKQEKSHDSTDQRHDPEENESDEAKTDDDVTRTEEEKLLETTVMNELMNIIDSRDESKIRMSHNRVFPILMKKIKAKLLEDGQCSDSSVCNSVAGKLACFVQEIMKETYQMKNSQRIEEEAPASRNWDAEGRFNGGRNTDDADIISDEMVWKDIEEETGEDGEDKLEANDTTNTGQASSQRQNLDVQTRTDMEVKRLRRMLLGRDSLSNALKTWSSTPRKFTTLAGGREAGDADSPEEVGKSPRRGIHEPKYFSSRDISVRATGRSTNANTNVASVRIQDAHRPPQRPVPVPSTSGISNVKRPHG